MYQETIMQEMKHHELYTQYPFVFMELQQHPSLKGS